MYSFPFISVTFYMLSSCFYMQEYEKCFVNSRDHVGKIGNIYVVLTYKIYKLLNLNKIIANSNKVVYNYSNVHI